MGLVKSAPNLMQRFSRLPAAPDVALLDRRKPKPYPWSHANTTFTTQIYIRWCCFDLSNAPDSPGLSTLRLLTSGLIGGYRNQLFVAARIVGRINVIEL